jgi:hypothetical protein
MFIKKSSIVADLLVLALGSVSVSAQAASVESASASIGNFSYQLIDLNPTDGIAPSIAFTSYSGTASSQGFSGFGNLSDSRSTLGATSVVSSKGRADTLLAPASVSSVAKAFLPDESNRQFAAQALYSQQFTLSADTLVIFSADSRLHVDYDRQNNRNSPKARSAMFGELNIDGIAGQPDYVSDFGEGASIDRASSFNSRLIGALQSLHSTAYGTISLGTRVEAGWMPWVSAVPEPGTYAMLLAGLALVGAVSRRKRANAH